MPLLVTGQTPVDAWKQGGNLLLQQPNRAAHNLITEITDPTSFDPAWYRLYNPKSIGRADSLSVVAKVLFPKLPRMPGEARAAYCARMSNLLKRARARGNIHSSWAGTYFERLVSLDGSPSQLERAIHALLKWPRREAAIVMHLSTPTCDALRPIGSPCLQFIEILWNTDDTIDLVALYRHHDFINKALGNFIGLGSLLSFIASEGQKKPGKIVCHSVRAYVDRVQQMQTLLAR